MTYKIIHLEKIYWKKYLYKIEIRNYQNDRIYNNDGIYIPQYIYDSTYNYFKKSLEECWKVNDKFRIHIGFLHTTVFLQDENDLNKLLILFNDLSIEKVFKPFNENEIKFLSDNDNVIIRNTLFYDEFRYKIHLKIKTLEDEKELTEWVTKFSENKGLISNKDYILTYSNKSLYLNDESLVLLFRLGLGKLAKNVTKIMLHKEIEVKNERITC